MEWVRVRCGLSTGSGWFQKDERRGGGDSGPLLISPKRAKNIS
jgi:hypothetical protein